MSIFDEVKRLPITDILGAFFPGIELKKNGRNLTAICPLHAEKTPSFKIDTDKNRWRCFGNANCGGGSSIDLLVRAGLADKPLGAAKMIAEKFALKVGGISGAKTGGTVERLTVAELAKWKKLDAKFLRDLGLRNAPQGVLIPYLTVPGELYSVRYRLNTDKEPRFRWASGSRLCLYGLDRLASIKKSGWCLFVEGESDCWTAWSYDLPALGVPGKTTWRSEWAPDLAGISVYVWQEPGAEDLAFRVARDVGDVHIIEAPDGVKDLSLAHLLGMNVPALIEELKVNAIPAEELLLSRAEAERAKLRRKAGKLLGADDPIELIKVGIRAAGYGGNLDYPVIIYLAATGRLLKMRRGSMPVHLQLLAIQSAGKSYAMQTVLGMLPPESQHHHDSGSARSMIYDEAELKYRVLVFPEIDSIPDGEDNNAVASAIRKLLQDHYLKYLVTVYDPSIRKYITTPIEKQGPITLFTTGIKRTGAQLDSRLFCVEVPDDAEQIREALITQGKIEESGIDDPAEELIAFQSYLQTLAPIDVYVPFAKQLAEKIPATSTRILRDYARLISFIKAVTIIRHVRRRKDKAGRLVSTIDDYSTVYELTKKIFASASTGASESVCKAVQAVVELRQCSGGVPVTVSATAKHLKISKASASRRINVALEHGWLVNKSPKEQGKKYDLDVGEPLPDEDNGLPHPELISDCSTVSADSGDGMGGRVFSEQGLLGSTVETPNGASPMFDEEL